MLFLLLLRDGERERPRVSAEEGGGGGRGRERAVRYHPGSSCNPFGVLADREVQLDFFGVSCAGGRKSILVTCPRQLTYLRKPPGTFSRSELLDEG